MANLDLPGAGGRRLSVAFPRQWWYPACLSGELQRAPVAFTLMDEPLVAFRDAHGDAQVLVDRCPHRNAPLSAGTVHRDGTLQCGYHGWRFDGTGRCTAVPGLGDPVGTEPSRRDADARSAREDGGVVWVWAGDGEPSRAPFAMPDVGRGRTVGQVVFREDMDCTMHASLENALDVPHTAFLHGGIFRKEREGPRLRAERREVPDGVEVQYVGEPAAFGPLRWPGAVFDHWDRFLLPSIAQVEYRVGDAVQIVNTILHLPLSATRTRAWFVLQFRSPLPARALAPIVRARGKRVLRQDVDMLERQAATIARFGGERYTSTDVDLLGNAIWRLLRRAERAEAGSEADPEPDSELGRDAVTLQL